MHGRLHRLLERPTYSGRLGALALVAAALVLEAGRRWV
jgi:hypothetical protein